MTIDVQRSLAILLLVGLLGSPRPGIAQVDDLPLVEVLIPSGQSYGADTRGPPLIILLSGDGGWAGMDQEISAFLSTNGVPVIGLNSLRYFWKARSPEEVTGDVARMVEHYLRELSLSRVVLVGYSFGAEVLPFIVNRLPTELRPKIDGVILISPSDSAYFEIHVTEWLPWLAPKGKPLAPELARLDAKQLFCIHGTEEHDSPCLGLAQAGARAQAISGGHHMGGQYQEVAKRVLGFVQQANSVKGPTESKPVSQ